MALAICFCSGAAGPGRLNRLASQEEGEALRPPEGPLRDET